VIKPEFTVIKMEEPKVEIVKEESPKETNKEVAQEIIKEPIIVYENAPFLQEKLENLSVIEILL
jgi:hypothetical protein